MHILFDHGTPSGVASALSARDMTEARERGWDTLSNGELLDAAEAAGFELLLTTDKQIPLSAEFVQAKNLDRCSRKFDVANLAIAPGASCARCERGEAGQLY
jgi:hypothetical protein